MAMRQQSLASQVGFEKYGRKSRRELFLDVMNKAVRWSELETLVAPPYAKAACIVGCREQFVDVALAIADMHDALRFREQRR